jgi:hypothetical protein
MKVIDMMGKEILNEAFTVSSGGTVKDLKLNTGAYVLVLVNDSGERISNKIIVH